ncbi:MAG: hypothetical protein AAF696_12230 [Bacteroidota bacterium]
MQIRNRNILIATILLAISFVLGRCTLQNRRAQSEDIEKRIINTINSWVNCTDCGDAEKVRVLELGEEAIELLKSMIIEGPSPVSRQLYYFQCLNIHFIAENCQSSTVGGSDNSDCRLPEKGSFCLYYLDAYVRDFRYQAFQLLSEIGENDELEFLEEQLDVFRNTQKEIEILVLSELIQKMRTRLTIIS